MFLSPRGLASFGLEPFREHGWRYKGDGIRVLSFSLKGDNQLPETSAPAPFAPLEFAGNEIEIDDDLAFEGYVLYHQASCAICHGSDVHSVGAAAPDLRESRTLLNYRTFRSIVVEGALLEKNMPLFDDLREGEVKAIYEYLLQQTMAAHNTPTGVGAKKN